MSGFFIAKDMKMSKLTDFTKLLGLRINVTQQDIADGIGGNCERCPVAIAIGRMFPDHSIHVDIVEVDIHMNGTSQAKMYLTESLFVWIDEFDNECEVKPITLEIQNSTEPDYQYQLAIV